MKVNSEQLSKVAQCVEAKLIETQEIDIEKIEPDTDGVNRYRLTVVYREFQPEKFGFAKGDN